MTVRLPLAGVALALVLAACGSDPQQREAEAAPQATATAASSPPTSTAPSPSLPNAAPTQAGLPDDPAAAQAVKDGIRGLLRAGSGTYELDVTLEPGTAIHEEGRYGLAPNAFDITRHSVSPEGVLTFAARGLGDEVWVRLVEAASVSGDSRSWPCWVRLGDPGGVADELGFPVLRGQPPNPLIAASYAVGLGFVEPDEVGGSGNVLGTTDLVTTLALLNSRAVGAAGLDTSSEATTLAYFTVRGGVLVGYSIGLRGVFAAVDAAGGAVPDGLDPEGPVPGTVEVVFDDLGDPVEVAAPAADEVVELTTLDDDALEQALAGCGAA